MLTPAAFYFLRHGETDWNRRRITQGQTDTELNATGLAQAAAVAAMVAKLPVATICCSPLRRATRTAEIVNHEVGKPVVPVADLMECGLGFCEGQASNGEWRAPWERGGPMPGGETFAEYTDRILRGFNKALAQPGPILIVAHGGNFWALEHHGFIRPGSRVSNCALFKLEPPRDKAKPRETKSRSSNFWTVEQLTVPDGAPRAIGEIAAP